MTTHSNADGPGDALVEVPPLFPPTVAVHALRFDSRAAVSPIDTAELPPSIRGSVGKRQREFLAGRRCARAALDRLGCADRTDIAIGHQGAPVWPRGYVGSISHASDIAVAAVANARDAMGIGIDVESIMAARASRSVSDMQALIATSTELALVGRSAPQTTAFVALFAAKEALFKCLAPLVSRYFDFLDVAAVEADPERLRLELRVDLGAGMTAGRAFDVSVAPHGDLLFAGVLLAS